MKAFFEVTALEDVFGLVPLFSPCGTEEISIEKSHGRRLAADIESQIDLPDFARSTVDGYAVKAASTFGATESNPAFLSVIGKIAMGEVPAISIRPGNAAEIPTGGMLPEGADAVVMVEHTEVLDERTIEVYRSAAPGQHMIETGEDIAKGDAVLRRGQMLRSQEVGLLAALGRTRVSVYRKPTIAVISTGDELLSIDAPAAYGKIRDLNTYTLSCLIEDAGAIPALFGIVKDDFQPLFQTVRLAMEQTDMVLLSGGSSVGTRDFTVEVFSGLPDSKILVHGISISPGKPTILAKAGEKAVWGLPGHVVSAMVVFKKVVDPFIRRIGGGGSKESGSRKFPARLTRNIASAQGRTDFIRVRTFEKEGDRWAEPILGKSGLIRTMLQADGLIEIGVNTEGLDHGTVVDVTPI